MKKGPNRNYKLINTKIEGDPYLASASKDQTVQVWDALTGKLLLT